MNHQLFEKWLLNKETLDKAQLRLLQEHLRSCSNCSRLAYNLTQVEQRLQSSPLVQPRIGFVKRFQTSLPLHRAARQQRQAWSMIISGLSIGTAIYVYHILPDLSQLSLGRILSTIFNGSLTTAETVLRIGQVSRYVLVGVPPFIPLAVWVSMTIVFLILSLIWVMALGRILTPKGEKA